MALTTAERNKRKRERKKRAREEERKRQEKAAAAAAAQPTTHDTEPEVEIEYVPEALLTMDDISGDVTMSNDNPAGGEADLTEDESISGVLKRFQARASVLVSDDETKQESDNVKEEIGLSDEDDEEDEELMEISKRKQRERDRPTVAELKNRVGRADLVEAHDVTAPDPIFLLYLKAVSGTVPVPRHWGRKRKYLQGKVSLFCVCT
jgi:splicing factor 3B subunit 2